MINVGNILSTVGVFSTMGVILSTVGDIMMHVVGYHEYRGGFSVPWGKNLLLFVIFSQYSNYKGWHPPQYRTPPPPPPLQVFPCCAETACSTPMELSDF